MKMMRWLLAVSVLVHHSYNVKRHLDDMEDLVEEIEMDMIMNEIDESMDFESFVNKS